MEWSSSGTKNRKRLLTWKDPTTSVCGILIHKCPRHYEKFSAFSTITMFWCSKHSIIVLCPWHYKSFTVQFFCFTFLCPVQSVSPLIFRWPDFLGRNLIFPSCSGMSVHSFHISRNWIQSPCQTLVSLGVIWAEPSGTWSPLFTSAVVCDGSMCTAKVSLSAAAVMSYI